MVGGVVTKTWETVRLQARVVLYKAVVQSVLLYGSKIWLVTGAMLKVLEGFHNQVVIKIMGMMERRTMSGEWE